MLRVLGGEARASLVRALLPRFYVWGTVCGAVALPAAMGVPLSFPEYRAPGVAVQAVAILAATLLMLYGGNSVTPAIVAALDRGAGGHEQAARLYRRTLALNGVALVIVIGLLVAFANRPAPRSSGILEPTPQERVRLEEEALRAQRARARSAPASRPAP